MALPDLSGATLGIYRVSEPLGLGTATIVYRALEESAGREVALKVLDPELAGRSAFLERLSDVHARLAALGEPRIVTVHEVATRDDLAYLTMRLVRGGTLRTLLRRGPLDVESARRIARDVAGALHRAHEAGVLHENLKPSNVLLDTDGSVVVADFGQSSGAPGYLSPEQALGLSGDRRSDVHGLGLLLYEMVTGRMGQGADAARATGRLLPAGLDQVLARALARDPAERPATVFELLDELDGVVPAFAGPRPGDDQLGALIEASLDPVLAIDASGRITRWNGRAEATFGWARREVLGRPILTTLVAPRHRELFERVLEAFLGGREPLPEGHSVEVGTLHRDGRLLTVEVSLSPVRLPGSTAVIAFCRDVSERREADRLLELRDAVGAAVSGAGSADELMRGVLEAVGVSLGWPAGAVWLLDEPGSRLRCRAFWHSPSVAGGALEALSGSVGYGPGVGLPGRAFAAREPVWQPDLTQLAESARERAALRAGLRAAAAVPITDDGVEPIGVLELFAPGGPAPGTARLAELEAAGRRLGRALGQVARASGRLRYKLDGRNTHLAFSCAFMKLLTVHGVFRDFGGWMEMEAGDPTTARAECAIRTASVDTGSLDRDYHLRSADFFAVERWPAMVFRSTRVEPLGDERFRLFGTLTIRDVTRQLRLEVRLEERDVDALGVERLTLTAGTVINRLDWFLDWEKALQAGRWIVGDEVRLDLVITLVRRPGVREQVL